MSKNFIFVVLLIGTIAVTKFFSSPKTVSAPSSELSDTKLSKLQVSCSGTPIPRLTEGPYYKPGSPQRQMIRDDTTSGMPLTLEGYVLDTECEPIEGAWLDVWQADGNGVYDNTGYTLRGHQFTDENGRYKLLTVIPGAYPGRTEHIHFKVRATETNSAITSQLFFPDSSGNTRDAIFDPTLVVTMADGTSGEQLAAFDIVTAK